MKYLSHRDGYYWVRIKPSLKLLPYLPIFPKKEYLESLGDVTQSQAERKAIPIIAKWIKEIDHAKKIVASSSTPSLNEQEFQELIASEPAYSEDVVQNCHFSILCLFFFLEECGAFAPPFP